VVIKKITIKGAKLIEINNARGVTLTFEGFNKLPPLVSSKAVPYPIQSKCEITGLPAKYLDPKTKLPYATLEAFKIIRERFDKTEVMDSQVSELEIADQESEESVKKEKEEGEGSAKKSSKKRKKKKKKKKKGSESEEDEEQEEEVIAPRRRRR